MTESERGVEDPWPLVADLARDELRGYLQAARTPEIQDLSTRCAPWTVRDLTAHLAMTFRRFADMLERSRRGDLTPPFAAADLTTENLQAVERFQGDPLVELERQAHRFLALISNPNECMAHQRGPIPVSLQLLFALNELAIHRDDLEVARGSRYRPADEVIEALIPIQEQLLGGLPSCGDPWQSILVRSGRPVAK